MRPYSMEGLTHVPPTKTSFLEDMIRNLGARKHEIEQERVQKRHRALIDALLRGEDLPGIDTRAERTPTAPTGSPLQRAMGGFAEGIQKQFDPSRPPQTHTPIEEAIATHRLQERLTPTQPVEHDYRHVNEVIKRLIEARDFEGVTLAQEMKQKGHSPSEIIKAVGDRVPERKEKPWIKAGIAENRRNQLLWGLQRNEVNRVPITTKEHAIEELENAGYFNYEDDLEIMRVLETYPSTETPETVTESPTKTKIEPRVTGLRRIGRGKAYVDAVKAYGTEATDQILSIAKDLERQGKSLEEISKMVKEAGYDPDLFLRFYR